VGGQNYVFCRPSVLLMILASQFGFRTECSQAFMRNAQRNRPDQSRKAV
jgi:hypothetical protein